MAIDNHVSVSVSLSTGAVSAPSFETMFLVDHADVPLDTRYRIVTPSSYSDDLTANANPAKFSAVYFGQKRTPEKLYIGRWASANTAPYFVCGDYETDYTVWEDIDDGSFTIVDNSTTPNEDVISVDFSGITALSQILTKLNDALGDVTTPNITGLNTAVFSFDALGRLILTHSVTGESAPTLSITTGATGETDLASSSFFDADNGLTISGVDAEEPTEAVTAIRAKSGGDAWRCLCIRGESAAQQLTLAAQIEALPKMLFLVSGVAGCKSSSSTTDNAYTLNQLGYDHTALFYTEHTITATGGWVDAAVLGCVLPATIGTTAFQLEDLIGVYVSGVDGTTPNELNQTAISALETKECNYITAVSPFTFNKWGHAVGGNEIRVVLGAMWLEESIQAEVMTYLIHTDLPAFDDATLSAVNRIIRKYLTEGKERGLLLDTRNYPITVKTFDADDFDSTDRASHNLVLTDAFSAYANSDAGYVRITGEIRG